MEPLLEIGCCRWLVEEDQAVSLAKWRVSFPRLKGRDHSLEIRLVPEIVIPLLASLIYLEDIADRACVVGDDKGFQRLSDAGRPCPVGYFDVAEVI